MRRAEHQFMKVEEKHGELMEVVEDQHEFEEEESWMSDCEMEYVQAMLHAKKYVAQTQSPAILPVVNQQAESQPRPSDVGLPATSQSTAPTPHAYSSSTPRMTRMQFPTFNGDLKEYRRFKEMFTHCTTGMSELHCFYQLRQSMVNTTEKNKIKGCINLERAWQELDECYGDQDKLVDSLLTELENLKAYERRGKADLPAMSQFVQTLQNFETHAEAIGLSGELNSKIMLSQIKHKLPEDHRIAYYKSIRDSGDTDSLTGLVKWLHAHLMLLEKVKSTVADAPAPPPPAKYDFRKVSRSTNAATVYNNNNNNNNNRSPRANNRQCALHPDAKTHYLKMCNKFRALPLQEKYKIMKESGICFRCGHDNCSAGKAPHDTNSCQFAAPCRIPTCGSNRHFSSICPVVYGDQERQRNTGQRNASVHVTTHTVDDDKLQAVLPTAMGYLRCGNQRYKVRLLLDDGSQATLVRKGIFPQTAQDIYQDHNLTLVGGTTVNRKLRLLDCHIEDIGRNWSYPLTLTEIDTPCGDIPIVHPDQLQQYSHLRDVDIEIAPSETIDVLLGVDNTHLMVWDEYILGERFDEPIAVRCPLGWFVQGGRTNSPSSLSNYVNVTAIGPIEDFIGLEKVGMEPKKCSCMTDSLNKEVL
ncbi:uncharacterized protein [Amphiura filiformis]|uniref:uncharacterized protein n=1 Tax=Amphiura filiformis TaxID=82378 RepID=UPI003B21A7DA